MDEPGGGARTTGSTIIGVAWSGGEPATTVLPCVPDWEGCQDADDAVVGVSCGVAYTGTGIAVPELLWAVIGMEAGE